MALTLQQYDVPLILLRDKVTTNSHTPLEQMIQTTPVARLGIVAHSHELDNINTGLVTMKILSGLYS